MERVSREDEESIIDQSEQARLAEETPLLPARMINEYTYCPRLAYLMWVQTEWDETSDTVEGAPSAANWPRPH